MLKIDSRRDEGATAWCEIKLHHVDEVKVDDIEKLERAVCRAERGEELFVERECSAADTARVSAKALDKLDADVDFLPELDESVGADRDDKLSLLARKNEVKRILVHVATLVHFSVW